MRIIKFEVRWTDMYGADDIRGFATVVVGTRSCPCKNVMQLNIPLMNAAKGAPTPVERIISNEILCMTNPIVHDYKDYEEKVRKVMTRRKIKSEAYLREECGMNQMKMNDYTTVETLNVSVPSWQEIEKEEAKRKAQAEREMRNKIEKQYQDKQTALFDKWHVGFCFGNKQFEEYERKQRALGYNGEFAAVNNICPGMVIRVEGYKEFIEELVALHKEWKAAKRNAWNMDAYIERSMWDHETFYTGQWLDENMVSDVRYYFPEAKDEDFERVYKEVQSREEY